MKAEYNRMNAEWTSDQAKDEKYQSSVKMKEDYDSNSNQNAHKNEGPFRCGRCSLFFKDKTAFLRHHVFHEGSVYTCDKCNKSFSDKNNLKMHKRNHTAYRKINGK